MTTFAVKLTAARIAKFLQGRRLGMPFQYAAQWAGIHRATAYRWIEEGERLEGEGVQGALRTDTNGAPLNPPVVDGNLFVAFAEAERMGEAQFVAANLAVIEKAAIAGTWQAAAWKLERSMPSQFGRRMEVKADVSARATVDLSAMTPEKADELADRLLSGDLDGDDEP